MVSICPTCGNEININFRNIKKNKKDRCIYCKRFYAVKRKGKNVELIEYENKVV